MNACVILFRDGDGGVRAIAARDGVPSDKAFEFDNRDDAIEWVLMNLPAAIDWQLVELDEL